MPISFVKGMDDYVLGVTKHGKESDRGLSQVNPSINSWKDKEKPLHRVTEERLKFRAKYVPNEVGWVPTVANCSVHLSAIFIVK
jgi:hypothetical protein